MYVGSGGPAGLQGPPPPPPPKHTPCPAIPLPPIFRLKFPSPPTPPAVSLPHLPLENPLSLFLLKEFN